MFAAVGKVTVKTKDLMPGIKKRLETLQKTHVLVGVPAGVENERPDEGITNAQLLYIHTHGVRKKVMRDEMNPKVESGEMLYSQAYQMWLLTHGSPLWQSPPRPVIEPAIEHEPNKKAIAKQLRAALDAALSGKDPVPELEKAGMLGQNVVRDWFVNPANGWPPNAPETIKEKGSDKPLIDTGELRKSITYVLRTEG